MNIPVITFTGTSAIAAGEGIFSLTLVDSPIKGSIGRAVG